MSSAEVAEGPAGSQHQHQHHQLQHHSFQQQQYQGQHGQDRHDQDQDRQQHHPVVAEPVSPRHLDEETWEMHKAHMAVLRGLDCKGTGGQAHYTEEAEGGAAARAYRQGEPLDSARDMHVHGKEEMGYLPEDYVPVDDYGVPLLETIPEASQELAAQSSCSLASPRPPSGAKTHAQVPRLKVKAMKGGGASARPTPRCTTLESVDELLAEGKAKVNTPRSLLAIDSALKESRHINPTKLAGKDASYWPAIDSKKYVEIRKHNWTQTDVDKDLTSIRGIHATIDFITSGLGTVEKGLVAAKEEIRMGQRESLEHELREAHQKYRKQAQWEVDKMQSQLDAQRKATNSMIENAILACKASLNREFDNRAIAIEKPLKANIEGLEKELKLKSTRIVEQEQEMEMLKQDRTHLEQKFNNLRTELELGTYSPLVTKLREELALEKDQSTYLKKLSTDLELDLQEVKGRQQEIQQELEETQQHVKDLQADNRAVYRDMVEKLQTYEKIGAAEIKGRDKQIGKLEEELAGSRQDLKRQVLIMDAFNARYELLVNAYEEEIKKYEEEAADERKRVTSFLRDSNVPALMRKLNVSVTSNRISSRNGISGLRRDVARLADDLNQAIVGIPDAIRMMSSATPTTAVHSPSLPATAGASVYGPPISSPLRPAQTDREGFLMTPSTAGGGPWPPLPSPRPPTCPVPLAPLGPRTPRTGQPMSYQFFQGAHSGVLAGLQGGGAGPRSPPVLAGGNGQGQGQVQQLQAGPGSGALMVLEPLAGNNIQVAETEEKKSQVFSLPARRTGAASFAPEWMEVDAGAQVAEMRDEMGRVINFINDYQVELRQTIADTAAYRSPRGLKMAQPSPRARVPKLVLPTSTASNSGRHEATDYHVHASVYHPDEVEIDTEISVFDTIAEAGEEVVLVEQQPGSDNQQSDTETQ